MSAFGHAIKQVRPSFKQIRGRHSLVTAIVSCIKLLTLGYYEVGERGKLGYQRCIIGHWVFSTPTRKAWANEDANLFLQRYKSEGRFWERMMRKARQ